MIFYRYYDFDNNQNTVAVGLVVDANGKYSLEGDNKRIYLEKLREKPVAIKLFYYIQN